MKRLQQQDANIETLKHKLQHNKLDKEYYSMDENGLLMRKVEDGGHEFHAIYLPNVLVFQVLQTLHHNLGHNGFLRTYAALKRVFYCDLILIKDNTAKSFQPLYKENYRVVKVHGNNVEIQDYRGNISMVHVTDVKTITLMEQVADDYENLGKQGRFSKKCIPRGYIPDFDWTTIHKGQDQPMKPIQQQDPTEDTTTPAAPTEVEGPPSSPKQSSN